MKYAGNTDECVYYLKITLRWRCEVLRTFNEWLCRILWKLDLLSSKSYISKFSFKFHSKVGKQTSQTKLYHTQLPITYLLSYKFYYHFRKFVTTWILPDENLVKQHNKLPLIHVLKLAAVSQLQFWWLSWYSNWSFWSPTWCTGTYEKKSFFKIFLCFFFIF